jgi:putative spermidine/putrescine transport system ATP-binding protein
MSRCLPTVLSLREVRKTFDEVVAVDDFSFDMTRGELVCLLGPSGCGKTTTLRLIAGFMKPTAGDILIAGTRVTDLPPYRRDTGMVFQNYALFPHLTVAENVGFGLRNLRMPPADREARVGEMLALVEVTELRARLPRELSGGQQQRVALARALALSPAVLLLDEPLSNLDARLRSRMREEIRELIRRLEITTLFVTHDQEEALALADRIVVMNRGRIEQIGSPPEIYQRPATRFVAEFIGLCNFFEGVVEESGGGCLVVRTARGLALAADAGGSPVQVGEEVIVAVRPQHVAIASEADGRNRFRARVRSSTYLGSISRHRLEIRGEEIVMECHGEAVRPLIPGSDVVVTCEPTRALLLPRGGQDRGRSPRGS